MRGANLARPVAPSCIWGASFLRVTVGLEGLTPIQLVVGCRSATPRP
jgi:hypothetical protein